MCFDLSRVNGIATESVKEGSCPIIVNKYLLYELLQLILRGIRKLTEQMMFDRVFNRRQVLPP